jgi:alpha-glucosidase (family GH31 glycosyl hydrolase)
MVMNIHYQNVYGMGENTHHSFRHEFSYTNWWGVFARDQPTGGKQFNNYGTHPFFMAVNKASGRALGVLIKNSNAQEYGFLPPSALAYRTLGGILDLYIMEESSPELLIKAYTSLIGKPYMPPYWALGKSYVSIDAQRVHYFKF